jgi:hypothetical protein
MRRSPGILILFAAALSNGAQAPSDKQNAPSYYPLKPGTKWTYEVDAGTGEKARMTNQIAKNEMIDGKSMARFETVFNSSVQQVEHLSSTPEGVFRCRINGTEVSPPVCVLKYPVKAGESWKADAKLGDQVLKMKFVAGKLKEVTTSAGTYKAVSVETETNDNGTNIKSKCWFAPDVGVVKQKLEIGDSSITLDLIKFEAGS